MADPTSSSGDEPRPTRRRRHTGRGWSLLVVLVLVALSGVGGPLIGKLSETQRNDSSSFLPKSAESTRVADLAAKFTDGPQQLPYLVVIERPSGLTAADSTAIAAFVAALPKLPIAAGQSTTLSTYLTAPPVAIPSADGQAVLVPVQVNADKLTETIGKKTVLSLVAQAVRDEASSMLKPAGLTTYVTGAGGLFADLVTAFAGIDGILLVVALVVVFLILLVVYRSPLLPFTVLFSAGIGLSLAALVVYPLAKNGTLALSGQSQGILSILVVGAATDYALLLVSRYREELHNEESAWRAMQRAWRAALPPIAASALTVVLGLLCLLLSQLGGTRGLGPVGALGIAGAFVASLTFLPAVLVLVGRRIFWPRIPRLDHTHDVDTLRASGLWSRVADLVGKHPRRVWALTLVALIALGAFTPTFKASGITTSQLFLTSVESVTGQDVLAQHFPAGSGSPVLVVAPQDRAQQVVTALTANAGLKNVQLGAVPGRAPKVVDGDVLIEATLVPASDSQAAEDLVASLRTSLDSISPDVLVGGSTAANLDVRTASDRDLKVLIPAILLVIFMVLSVLLRSLLAPLVLVVANVVSFGATIGASALMFNHVFHFPGADPATPLYAFVFLVALGIDYSIFLMTRVREETLQRSTRPGILTGLAVTGGVITSAGVVLAATFSALAVIPILFLAQIAFIVPFGVLLDTLIVRSLLVPAFSYDLGARVWWPSRLRREQGVR